MKKLLLLLFFVSFSYAVSPFSLEGIKAVNLAFVDKEKLLEPSQKEKIKNEIITRLKQLGVKTQSDDFSNFIIKIDGLKVADKYVVNVRMFIVENVTPERNKEHYTVGITYQKDDFFEADNLNNDLYESIIDYLFADFEEQYIDENNLVQKIYN